MTTTKSSKTTAPLAHRVPAEVSALINTYAAWIEEQTGYKADPMSVYLGSQLRSTFQKGDANQQRLAEAAAARVLADAAKATAKAAREAAAAKKAAEPKPVTTAPKSVAKPAPKAAPKKAALKKAKAPAKAGSIIATAEGVVVAEQTHIEAV